MRVSCHKYAEFGNRIDVLMGEHQNSETPSSSQSASDSNFFPHHLSIFLLFIEEAFLLFMKRGEKKSIILELKMLLDYENYAKNQKKSSVSRGKKQKHLYLNIFMTLPVPVKSFFLLRQTSPGLSPGCPHCCYKSTLCSEQPFKSIYGARPDLKAFSSHGRLL